MIRIDNVWTLLIFLLAFVNSTLKEGQNPYKILGVRKGATETEIKKAYRAITFKHHPDVSKTKESERIWMEASDAYELLLDKRRRQIYDQTGSVSEDPPQQQSYHQSPFHFYTQNQYQSRRIQFKTQLVYDTQDIITKLGNSIDGIVFIYSSSRTSIMYEYLELFEEIAEQYKVLIPFMRNDAQQSTKLYHQFSIKYVPAFVYVKKLSNGKLIYKQMNSRINSREDVIGWMINSWEPQYQKLQSTSDALKWLKKEEAYTHILIIDRGNEPGIELKRAATIYGSMVKFGFLCDDFIKAIPTFKLTELPSTLVFRRNTSFTVQSLLTDIKYFKHPKFFALERSSLKTICSKFCLVYIGKPTEYQINQYSNQFNHSIACTPSKSQFAKQLNLKDHDWIIIEGNSNQYTKLDRSNLLRDLEKYKRRTMYMRKIPSHALIDWSLNDELFKLKEFYEASSNEISTFIRNLFDIEFSMRNPINIIIITTLVFMVMFSLLICVLV